MKVVKNFTFLFISLAILLLTGAFILNNFVYINKPVQIAMNSSALIHNSNNGKGSGAIFINGDKTFMWTCFHVLQDNVSLQMKFDGQTLKYITSVETKPVKITSKLFTDEPREVGEITLYANIIRFSEKDDVALLELPHGYFKQSVKFPHNKKYVPLAGTQIFHVGNFSGDWGEKSITQGITGVCGFDLDGNGVIYDRIGLSFEHGSSGGGVFEHNSGNCIGLIARTTNPKICNQGLIIPYRRLCEIATKLDCEWALKRAFIPDRNYLNTLSHDTWDIPEEVRQILRNNR